MVSKERRQTKPVIAVVDRNTASADLVARHLRHHLRSVKVVTANSCEQTRRLVSRTRVSIFLVDRDLPDGKGEDLLQELLAALPCARGLLMGRTKPPTLNIPRLLGYLLKPLSMDDLLDNLRVTAYQDIERLDCLTEGDGDSPKPVGGV